MYIIIRDLDGELALRNYEYIKICINAVLAVLGMYV